VSNVPRHAVSSLLAIVTLSATAHAKPTPTGAVLLNVDGVASIPSDVRARMKTVNVTQHEISYRPNVDGNAGALAWRLSFGTIEDPTTHYHYIHDINITLVDNKDFTCSAKSSDLVVDADKVSTPHGVIANGSAPRVATRTIRKGSRLG
jgi:hypothetical protein